MTGPDCASDCCVSTDLGYWLCAPDAGYCEYDPCAACGPDEECVTADGVQMCLALCWSDTDCFDCCVPTDMGTLVCAPSYAYCD